MSWTTIESDPGVFTELVTNMGVENIQFEEIYSLDNLTLNLLKPIYGLIFLFKYKKEIDPRPTIDDSNLTDLFFARQMIENACATQAIINCLLNRVDVNIGPDLSAYKDFTTGLPAEMKGIALDEVKRVKLAHNSFARPEPIMRESNDKNDTEGDAYHFITYVPCNGSLYELDGLKNGPIFLDHCTLDDWTDKVIPHLQDRIQKYSQSEIRFNLMAIIKNRAEHMKSQITELEVNRNKIQAKLDNVISGVQVMEDELPSTKEELELGLTTIDNQVAQYKNEITEEEHKFKKWKAENIRRKHNYIPFIFNTLKVLAEKNQLLPLVEASIKKQSKLLGNKRKN